ncbi:MAG: hypothetical protein ACREJ3_01560 [Polyangiaceae bacterium]
MAPRVLSALLLASLLQVATPARAGDPAAAEALFQEGKQLMSEERYDLACPKFEESQKADPGLGTQFHLADCWEHLGRQASAWALFLEVESEARTLGQVGRERVAKDRATALAPLLPKLVISPHGASGTPGLELRRDGEVIGREQWNVAVPVDPGVHVVAAFAPHKMPWETRVQVPAVGSWVTVNVPPLAEVPGDVPVAITAIPTALPVADAIPRAFADANPRADAIPRAGLGVTSLMPSPEVPVLQRRGSFQRAAGWFIAGAGIAGLATGAYFGLTWANERNDAGAHCTGELCDGTGVRLRHDAEVHGDTAIATAGAGALGVILGAALAATAPGPHIVALPSGVELSPTAGLGRAGLDVRGVW